MISHRRAKRTVEKIVEEAYWEGFFACLENGSSSRTLHYTSDSGWYQYNEAADIAYAAGYVYCQEVLAERAERVAGKRGLPFFTIKRKVPGHVIADAYAAARIAVKEKRPSGEGLSK